METFFSIILITIGITQLVKILTPVKGKGLILVALIIGVFQNYMIYNNELLWFGNLEVVAALTATGLVAFLNQFRK